MHKYQFQYSILFLLTLLYVHLSAQQTGLLKSFLIVDEGLSHDEVTAIVQDHDGFIWIGTRGGLNRYDGYEFKIFNQVPGDSNSLVNPSIESLFVDSKGNIWIGTKSGGVSKYNPKSGIFKNIVSNYKHPGSILPDNRILSFYEDSKGRIWMGTWANGLVIYDEESNSSKQYLGNRLVNSIVGQVNGTVWVASNNGLFEYNASSDSFILNSSLPANIVCQELIVDEKRNVLWIAAQINFGLVKLDLNNNNWKSYKIGGSNSNQQNQVHVYQSIWLTEQGKIWLGTWGTGYYSFNPENEKFERFLIYPENQATLNKDYDAVLDIFQDRDDNIWLGTNGGGVCVLTPKLEFSSVGYHPEPNKGLINTRIMSVVDDTNGNLWLGTIGSGLIWSPDRENFYRVKYPGNMGESGFFIIKYLYPDNSGGVWVGTNSGTFNISFENNEPKLVNIREKYPLSQFPDNFQVVSMLDANNMFWLGTLDNGLILQDKERGYRTLKHFHVNNKESGILNCNRISYLLRDSKERIWIGTYNGLHVYESSDSTINLAENSFKIEGDFSGNIITCIDEDLKGNIWIGTPNGLNRLTETRENSFRNDVFTENHGLASNFIKAISHDLNGNIWVSTNIGISKYNAENNSFANYSETDGVKGKNFTEASVFRNQKGELFFGGTMGLTYFQPEKIMTLHAVNQPVFTGLKVLNQPVEVNQKFGPVIILNQSIFHTREITIPYRFNNFEIQFSALDFKSNGKNRYQYKLENYDESWNDIGTRRFLIFNNLRWGDYILKVKSANSQNVWNETAAEIKIKVLPPFWQTWYALVFYILLVVAIVSLIRWNAVKQERLASNLEMEKMQHAQDQKISEMKFQFFTNISHEFRTPLTLILAPLKEILNSENQKSLSDEVLNKIQIVQKNAIRLMRLVNQLLDFRKAETGNMKLYARISNLEEFVNEVCLPFYELAKINEIDFSVYLKLTTKNIWFDPEKMEIILNNLISNAFKFTKEKGKIEISLFEEEDEILLTVADNGPGIPPTEINHIFDRFYRIEKGDNMGSSGIGLALVKRLVELHKGSISVFSQPNKNTEFVVSLQKGNKHLLPEEMIQTEDFIKSIERNEPIFSGIFPAKSKAKPKSEECILIVEDNQEVNDYLKHLLEPFYNVKVAFDGSEGYDLAIETIPDIIVSDVMMPKMDGFELCEKIKSNKKTSTIPVILLTAKSAGQFKLLGTQMGADEYISKPFDPNYLVEKIQNLLTSRKKLQKQFSKSVRLEPSDIEITDSEEQFISKTLAIIEKNLQNPDFSSDVLAAGLNMSSSSLYRKLKNITGFSTAEFIRSIRIKRAAQLLADKQLTITEIAYDVGFIDIKHFRAVFQKQFGCTPSEYRAKLNQ